MNEIGGTGMIEIRKDEQIDLFDNPTDSVIISMLEGKKGTIWSDENKTQAFAFDGIYGYLDGQVTKQFVTEAIEMARNTGTINKVTIIPQNEISEMVLLQVLNDMKQYEKKTRYLMKEPEEGMNPRLLKRYVDLLPENMHIESLNKDYFIRIKNDKTLEYLAESYKDYDDFNDMGVGFLITENNNIVAGAVSYSVFSKGIEMLIMTLPEYRGRGLAAVAAARLLIYCAENNLKAVWDAENTISVSVAKKMGYVLKRKYNAYTFMR